MEPVSLELGGDARRSVHPAPGFRPASPERRQAPERGSELQPALLEPRVVRSRIALVRTAIERPGRDGSGRGEAGARVERPPRLRRRTGAGRAVDLDRPARGGIGDHDLDDPIVALRDHQGLDDQQILHRGRGGRRADRQRHLDVAARGEHDRPLDAVIGQVGRRPRAEARLVERGHGGRDPSLHERMQRGLGRSGRRALAGRGRARRVPAPPPLPRVARQAHAPAPCRVHRVPPDLEPGAVERAERRQDRGGLAAVAAQRRERLARFGAGPETLEDGSPQHRMRADLDEERVSSRREDLDGRSEEHGLPDAGGPVSRPELRAFRRASGHRRDERPLHRAGRDAGQGPRELVAQRLELEAVERVVHRKQMGSDASLPEPPRGVLDGGGGARQHDRRRPVDGGHAELLVQQRLDVLPREADRQHPPPPGDPLHDPTALHDDPRRIVQRERTRHERGGDLAHAVSRDRVRPHAPLAPERGERRLQREERRLRDLRPVHARMRGVRPDLVDHRPARVAPDRRVAFLQRGAELGPSVEQLAPHSGPLRALPREHEGEPRPPLPVRGPVPSVPVRGELPDHLRRRRADDGEAALVMGSPHGRGVADIREPRRAVAPEPGVVVVGERDQRLVGLGGEGQHVRGRRLGRLGSRPGRDLRRLLEHHVGVGPSEAERAHAREPPAAAAGPRHRLGRDDEARAGEGQMGVEPREMQLRGNEAVLQAEQRLDETGDARRRLQVADVGLHRPERARVRPGRRPAVHRAEGLDLDRIAQDRPGPVRLDVVHLLRGDLAVLERLPDHRGLGDAARRGEHRGAPVLVHRRAPDESEHPIAVGEGVRQPLEHHDPAALAPHEAVRARVEGLAATVRRHEAPLRERDRHLGREHQAHASRHRERALLRAEAAAREVHRHQRRGARGIDGEARAAQVEQVRQPVRHDAVGGAGARPRVDAASVGGHERGVVVVVARHEHAGRAPVQRGARLARVLERLPRHLEQQALLRVHAGRLAGRDAEELGIEAVDRAEEAPPSRAHLPGRGRIRVVQRVDRPPIGRHLADGVDPVHEQAPEALRIARVAREAAAHPDHRDGLRAGHPGAVQILAGLAGEQGELDRRELGQAARVIGHGRASGRRATPAPLPRRTAGRPARPPARPTRPTRSRRGRSMPDPERCGPTGRRRGRRRSDD